MSFEYPQFGNPDYSGFTTEEELARRYITSEARGSPTIGAQMYIPGGMLSGATGTSGASNKQTAPAGALIGADAPARVGNPSDKPKSVSEAVIEIFRSQPLSALDWIIVFILIIATVCFFQHAGDLISTLFRTKRTDPVRIVGGNFCNACGGTV